jgi:hypothetical protein
VGGASGRRRAEAAAVEELPGAVIRTAWVRGNGIELVRELQWEVGVLAEHWVAHVG